MNTVTATYTNHDTSNLNLSYIALIALRTFYALLLAIICISNRGGRKLFFTHHGRFHRLSGLAHLSWLVFGMTSVVYPRDSYAISWTLRCLIYDIVLGLFGITATLSAARNFPHKRVTNQPGESGTLSKTAIVTQSEMVEHSFYQGLNLCQALYLNVMTWAGKEGFLSKGWRFFALWLVTLPWMARRMFPVNSFSANWNSEKSTDKENDDEENEYVRVGDKRKNNPVFLNRMYRIKKWQYIFYKHVILHGLNISIALSKHDVNELALPLTLEWRVFWLCLNSSYVMEFFMQSLVKRGILSQDLMLVLQWILMGSSSLAAVGAVLFNVFYGAAVLSLSLNFVNRRHDVMNTLIAASVYLSLRGW